MAFVPRRFFPDYSWAFRLGMWRRNRSGGKITIVAGYSLDYECGWRRKYHGSKFGRAFLRRTAV
jgi:hypothetical protein